MITLKPVTLQHITYYEIILGSVDCRQTKLLPILSKKKTCYVKWNRLNAEFEQKITKEHHFASVQLLAD